MLDYKLAIKKGVPIPRLARPSYVASVLKQMEIGDSFVLSGDRAKSDATTIRHIAKKVGIKVTARTIETNQVRVWRRE